MSKPKAVPAPLSDFPNIGAPAESALRAVGLFHLKQLTRFSEADLLQLHGMGPKALGRLREALKAKGLAFKAAPPKNKSRMPSAVRTKLRDVWSHNVQVQSRAYFYLMEQTEQPVAWAYEAWDELLAGLTHSDNHVRASTAQVLVNLAKSDPKGRILKDFERLLKVTYDKRFVTARHCLQCLWKVGLGGRKHEELVLNGFSRRFADCADEKAKSVIRADIIQGLKNLFQITSREPLQTTALALIETEPDAKLRKKYTGVWRK